MKKKKFIITIGRTYVASYSNKTNCCELVGSIDNAMTFSLDESNVVVNNIANMLEIDRLDLVVREVEEMARIDLLGVGTVTHLVRNHYKTELGVREGSEAILFGIGEAEKIVESYNSLNNQNKAVIRKTLTYPLPF